MAMQNHFLIQRLRPNLEAILCQGYTPQQLNELVRLAHAIAVTMLEIRSASGSINHEIVHLSSHDAAYDCIADLFRRDDNNTLLAFNAYFSAYRLPELSDADLLSHFRRLIFTKVNDGIARLYHEGDPALSRILRNIRLAAGSLGNSVAQDRFGEQFLAPVQCDLNEHLPPLDEHELESLLISIMQKHENIMEIIGGLVLALRTQSDRCRMVNLMQAALLIRSIYARRSLVLLSSNGHPAEQDGDLQRTITDAVSRIRHRFHAKYVHKHKVDAHTYLLYFDVIDAKIRQMTADGSPNGVSLYTLLHRSSPSISEEEYHQRHKSRLEYLFKLSCDEVVKDIRR